MTDHRRVQRALFRMQLDPGFAALLRAREPAAVASTGLADEDLGLLLQAPRAGVEADAGGRRRAQFLRNVGSEHALTLARAAERDRDLLESFTGSPPFHDAIARDLRLPPAFARHAIARASRSGDELLLALARIEGAMVTARRGGVPRANPGPGEIVLATRADVLELPEGSLAAAAELRRALDDGRAARTRLPEDRASEHVLVLGHPPPHAHALGEATIEVLSPLAGDLLLRSREPVGQDGLAAFRAAHGVEPEELAPFVESLRLEGILLAG